MTAYPQKVKKEIGHVKTLIGWPNLYGKTKCFGCRWKYLLAGFFNPILAFQVKVWYLGSYQWINVDYKDFVRA